MKNALEHGLRVYLIDQINSLLIRFTGEGLTNKGIETRMKMPLNELEQEYQSKMFAYNMHELNWN